MMIETASTAPKLHCIMPHMNPKSTRTMAKTVTVARMARRAEPVKKHSARNEEPKAIIHDSSVELNMSMSTNVVTHKSLT